MITDWRQPSLLLSRMGLGDSPDHQERVAAHKNAPFPSFLEQLSLCLSFGMRWRELKILTLLFRILNRMKRVFY